MKSVMSMTSAEEAAIVEWLEEINRPLEYPDGVS